MHARAVVRGGVAVRVVLLLLGRLPRRRHRELPGVPVRPDVVAVLRLQRRRLHLRGRRLRHLRPAPPPRRHRVPAGGQAPDGEPRDQPLNDGNEACQTLGNLCALAMYEADAAACQLFQQVALEQSSFVNQEDQWKMRMPWLYYSSGPLPYSIDNVDLRVALGIEGTYTLTYWLASYSLNGTYLGLEKLGTQLQLCAGVASDPNAYLSFGTGLEAKCEVPLSRLLAVTEPTFYDLYLQVEGEKLYPVPTRVINLRVAARASTTTWRRRAPPSRTTSSSAASSSSTARAAASPARARRRWCATCRRRR